MQYNVSLLYHLYFVTSKTPFPQVTKIYSHVVLFYSFSFCTEVCEHFEVTSVRGVWQGPISSFCVWIMQLPQQHWLKTLFLPIDGKWKGLLLQIQLYPTDLYVCPYTRTTVVIRSLRLRTSVSIHTVDSSLSSSPPPSSTSRPHSGSSRCFSV